jgi:hypothetical protein
MTQKPLVEPDDDSLDDDGPDTSKRKQEDAADDDLGNTVEKLTKKTGTFTFDETTGKVKYKNPLQSSPPESTPPGNCDLPSGPFDFTTCDLGEVLRRSPDPYPNVTDQDLLNMDPGDRSDTEVQKEKDQDRQHLDDLLNGTDSNNGSFNGEEGGG